MIETRPDSEEINRRLRAVCENSRISNFAYTTLSFLPTPVVRFVLDECRILGLPLKGWFRDPDQGFVMRLQIGGGDPKWIIGIPRDITPLEASLRLPLTIARAWTAHHFYHEPHDALRRRADAVLDSWHLDGPRTSFRLADHHPYFRKEF
ncbi:MAG: hypothetical protein AAF333_04085 [Planctomycetota bacterium]